MPRGVWADRSIAKRSAAARKGAQARGKRAALRRFLATGEPVADAAEIAAARGSEAHKALAGARIRETIDRLRARTVEHPGDVSRGTEAAE